MLKWLLFETRIGDRLLAALERLTGLALIEIGTLDLEKRAPVL